VYDLKDYSSSESTEATSTRSLEKNVVDHKLLLERGTLSIEVIGEGTKLMKSIRFPTVTIKTRMTNLQSSTVFYVTLDLDSKEFLGKIPALLFTSPYCSSRQTGIAELLPLHVIRSRQNPEFIALTPMLTSSSYKMLFRKGCSFLINSLERGRALHSSEDDPWNVFCPRIKEVEERIADIIYDHIRQIPEAISRKLKPLKRIKTYKPRSRLSKRSPSESSVKLLQVQRVRKLSDYCSNLKVPGLTASGGSSFAEWFKAIPADVQVDQNFTCDRGTTLTRDLFSDMKMLDKYLCISEDL